MSPSTRTYTDVAIKIKSFSMTHITSKDFMDPEGAAMFEAILGEAPLEQKPRNLPRENEYFLLDLRLPDFSRESDDLASVPEESGTVVKYGFLEMLEEIHGRDLRKNNPWLNPEVAASRLKGYRKRRKQVRFSTTEISPAVLPHCRRNNFSKISDGQLHSPKCRNAMSETVEVLGDAVWHNRVYIVETCVKRAVDRSEFYHDDTGTEEDGYYGRTEDATTEVMPVFDSVELRKKQLCLEPTVPTPSTSFLHSPDTDTHSDDSITSTSTLKHIDVQLDDEPPKSADVDSAFGDYTFEMFETARLRKPSDSDYESAIPSDSEPELDFETEGDLNDLVEHVTKCSIQQMWFQEPPPAEGVPGTSAEEAAPAEGVPGTSAEEAALVHRTPWPNLQGLSGGVELKESSAIGDLLAPSTTTSLDVKQFTKFMFDSPPPPEEL